MLGFLSFFVVLAVLSLTLWVIGATLENASDTIVSAIRGENRGIAVTAVVHRRNQHRVVVTRPPFAPLRAAA